MYKNKADYTNTFCLLMNKDFQKNKMFNDKKFIDWHRKWEDRSKKNNSFEETLKIMRTANPLVIPRNHKVEEV